MILSLPDIDEGMDDHIPSSNTERNPAHNPSLDVHPSHLTTSNLKLAIVNYCSITNKHPHLEAFLVSNNIDILVGTESHLDELYLNSEIFPRNYNTYGKDRNCYGGGVFISVKSTVPSYIPD